MSNQLIQFSHGVLTSASDPQTTYSDPLPSFNPPAADLPANPFAQATDNTTLESLDTDPDQAPAPEGSDDPAPDASAPASDAPAADAPADAPADAAADAPADAADAADASATASKSKK